jgi:hypothetical protein
MKATFFFSLFFLQSLILTNISHAAAAAERKSQSEKNCPLVIFIDDTESTLDSTSTGLIVALEQEACPLLVTKELFLNVTRTSFTKELNTEEVARLRDLAESESLDCKEKKELKDLFVSYTEIQKDCDRRWDLQEVNQSFVFLYPKGSPKASCFKQHAKTSCAEITRPDPKKACLLKDTLPLICYSKEECKEKRETCSYSFYVNGHGYMNKSICGMPLEIFSSFVNSLETFTTKLLIYSSCYASGLTSKKIYQGLLKESEKPIKKAFSFPIITTALTDSTIVTRITISVRFNYTKLITELNFKCFAEETEKEHPDYKQIALCLNGYREKIENSAQILYPGQNWFSLLDTESILAIDSNCNPLQAARVEIPAQHKPLPLGIALYLRAVPFELFFPTNLPKIISLLPGEASHYIKK